LGDAAIAAECIRHQRQDSHAALGFKVWRTGTDVMSE
jgi:hypothetical protein